MFKKFLLILTLFIFTYNLSSAAVGHITGYVLSQDGGEELIGASVMINELSVGDITDFVGKYEIRDVTPGTYKISVSFMGYETVTKEVTVEANKVVQLNFRLSGTEVMSKSITVVSGRAKFRETPVAFADIEKKDMELKLGSRDIPMVLNGQPGVYATETGGGPGDARINIRGFDQRNISVMVNGVPVNDMENGWVYWSNWDGLGDVTLSAQVQRGLGAGMLANPSVGGTMNIITDPAQMKPGIKVKQEIGNDAFLKTTFVGNTGRLGDDFALSVAGVRKTGDGIVDMTYSDAWAYYVGMSYNVHKDHQLEFYLMGAPQVHGQRTYTNEMALYDHQYALDQGVNPLYVTGDEGVTERGLLFNQHWGYISDPGKSYYNGSEHDARFDDRLMERENYYHKPQMNLNWHWQISDMTSLTNIFYLSTGTGGGTGTYGDWLNTTDDGLVDFQSAYDINIDNIDEEYSTTENRSTSILRNSVNNHFWMGWLGTAKHKLNNNLTLQAGLDMRYYKGEHYREVRNLLGGDYFINTSDKSVDYDANPMAAVKKLGDKIAYYNDGLVQWMGGFAQAEYKQDDFVGYLNTSLSNTGYKRVDYFKPIEDKETDWANFLGYTVKGGANYNISRVFNIYGNLGWYDRAPGFDAVYSEDNTKYDPVYNEKVLAFEIGSGYYNPVFQANLNLYYTNWLDRTWSMHLEDQDEGTEYYYLLRGIDALHMGAELDFRYNPHEMFTLRGAVSIGDWQWQNDVETTFSPDDNLSLVDTINVYVDGLPVGDAAQKTYSIGLIFKPVEKAFLNVIYTYYTDHYANFDPSDRTDPDDDSNPWKIPDYGLLHLNGQYTLPLNMNFEIGIFFHVFNLLDEVYISDATDADVNDKSHTATGASVYFGLPRRWNAGIQIAF